MKKEQPANAIPKILAFVQGNPIQNISLFIPSIKLEWITMIKTVKNVVYISEKKQWTMPYSTSIIEELELLFGQDILFAFKIGQHLGNHKTDK